jgi:hypothetical protein
MELIEVEVPIPDREFAMVLTVDSSRRHLGY